jgi:hypothetical protein
MIISNSRDYRRDQDYREIISRLTRDYLASKIDARLSRLKRDNLDSRDKRAIISA